MKADGYNSACRINGEKLSSVMLSATTCCTSPRNITNDDDNHIDDVVETMTIISTVKNQTYKNKQQGSNNGGRRGNLWSEKSNGTKTKTTSTKTKSGTNFPSIGASELMGIMPCGREPSSIDPRTSDTGESSNGGGKVNNKPFASNPLVDRGDSLVREQASLLSLIASETMETVTSPENTKGDEIGLTPPGQNRRVDDQKSTSTPSSRDNKKGSGQNEYITPPRRIPSSSLMERRQQSSTPPPPMMAPDSPAMELSVAK